MQSPTFIGLKEFERPAIEPLNEKVKYFTDLAKPLTKIPRPLEIEIPSGPISDGGQLLSGFKVVIFWHGMSGIYSIDRKRMVIDVDVNVEKGDSPLSTLDHALTEGVNDPSVFGRSFSFIDDQFDLYQFRNALACHFYAALSGGKEKRLFRFKLYCKPAHFYELLQQKPNPHVAVTQPKFRGHSGGSLLTHDSIFKVVLPSTEASLKFESVDLLFNLLGFFLKLLATYQF